MSIIFYINIRQMKFTHYNDLQNPIFNLMAYYILKL